MDEEQKEISAKFQRGGSITISTTINSEIWKAAKEHNISWAKAMELGLKVALNEIDNQTYPEPDCLLSRKVLRLSEFLQEATYRADAAELKLKEM